MAGAAFCLAAVMSLVGVLMVFVPDDPLPCFLLDPLADLLFPSSSLESASLPVKSSSTDP